MKTYQQMAFEVLKARDAYFTKKQHKIRMFKITCPIALSFSFAVLAGLNVWEQQKAFPSVQSMPEVFSETESPSETETESKMQAMNILETIPETLPVQTAEPVTEFSEVPEMIETFPIAESVPEQPVLLETEYSVPETEMITIISEQEQEIFTEQETFAENIPETILETIPETTPKTSENKSNNLQVFLHLPERIQTLQKDAQPEEVPFLATGEEISAEQVGEWFDKVDMIIHYPDGTEELLEHVGEAYFLKDDLDGEVVAVQFEGDENYYLFRQEN